MIKILLGILHGLWFMANIIAANHVAELHPVVDPSKEFGTGPGFGILTCIGTIISLFFTANYDKFDDDDNGWLATIASVHTAIVVAIGYGWFSYLG